VLDYHLHVWPHGTRAIGPTLERLAQYCENAGAQGVSEIALTEHLFRFRQADAVLGGWWADSDDPRLAAQMANYWSQHAHADLDEYVEVVLAAKAAGLPVVLGLEVDHYAGRMHQVAELLAGYPFDVLLGSVHWIGAWGFDILEDPIAAGEWDRRAVEDVWDEYTRALEELADSRVCDVLAHPDLCKVAGRRPAMPDEFYDRMAAAASRSGMAAEVSSAGWRKPAAEVYPAPPLLSRFQRAGVPITTASDAHSLPDVAFRMADVRDIVRSAGYSELVGFRQRRAHTVTLAAAESQPEGESN
jgi:histidinol-phosphatase (PHP family)